MRIGYGVSNGRGHELTGGRGYWKSPDQIAEVGEVSLSDTIDGGVEASVTFSRSYTSPVVVTFLATYAGSQSVQCRAKNVTSDGCAIHMEEPDNGQHNGETVCYIVMEAGVHEVDGVLFEAGTHTTSAVRTSANGQTFGDAVSFSQSWAAAPAVLHNLQTYANGAFMATQANSVSTTSFNISQEAAQTGKSGATEDIGWIAVENVGATTLNGHPVEVNVRNDGYKEGNDEQPHGITFSSFSSTPTAVVSGQTMNGTDGYWARGGGTWSSTELTVYAEEDQVTDSERSHADETFGSLAIEKGATF